MINSHRSGKTGLWQFCRFLPLTTIVVACLATPLAAQTHGFVQIDAPGAGTLQNQGTTASVINQSGVVAGYYNDDQYAYHGFVRSAQGVITEFDAPGLTNTQIFGINSSGEVAGYGLHDANNHGVYPGFLRTAKGAFRGFRAPDALSTFSAGMNDSGEITGTYYTLAGVYRGFVASSEGSTFTYTLFAEPDASKQEGYGTFSTAINAQGVVVGYYEDATVGAFHGYTRDRAGSFTSFDAPGAGTGQAYGTIPVAINGSGEIVGYYSDSNAVLHGFFRDTQGNFTQIDPPGSTQTFASSINDQGEIVGYWADSHQIYHGFLRQPSGNIKSFSVPVKNNGTVVLSINNTGQMTGFYYDTVAAAHGFLWQAPSPEIP